MSQLETVTYRNSEAATNSAAYSKALQGQAEKLYRLASEIQSAVYGGNSISYEQAPTSNQPQYALGKNVVPLSKVRKPVITKKTAENASKVAKAAVATDQEKTETPKPQAEGSASAKEKASGETVPFSNDPRFEDL